MFVNFFRRQTQRPVLALGDFNQPVVERNDLSAAAATLSALAVPFVGEKMFERSEQEGAEPSAIAVYIFEIILFQKALKKTLSQILGRFFVVARATNEGVKR